MGFGMKRTRSQIERLSEIRRWAEGLSELDLLVAQQYLEELRASVKSVIEENPNSSTKPEELVFRILSLVLLKLEILIQERRA